MKSSRQRLTNDRALTTIHYRSLMLRIRRSAALCLIAFFLAIDAAAQSPPPPSPPPAPAPPPPPALWDAQVGASFVGTSGNSDTATTGVDFLAHRRGLVWQVETSATAVRTANLDQTTAERYFTMLRVQRKFSPVVALAASGKFEHDRFSGLNLRSLIDGSVNWAVWHRPEWTLDTAVGIAWLHESRIIGRDVNDPTGSFQVLSRLPIGALGDTTQRFTFYPNFATRSAYRSEVEISAQAAMTTHFALKIGYLLRYSNAPVPGFKNTDTTTTASIVLRWRSALPAPAP
jgi:putative salt-induced outer membrane protein YdiY